MRHSARKWGWLRVWLAVGMLAGCVTYEPPVPQPIPRFVATPQPVELPPGYYAWAVWLDDETLALAYEEEEPGALPNQLVTFHLASASLEMLPMPVLGSECPGIDILRLVRINVGQVAFLVRCGFGPPEHAWDDRLYIWDAATQEMTQLQRYPEYFGASDFAVSPDLAHVLQEHMGDGIYNQLYLADAEGTLTRVFTDTWRIGSPAWSPDGRQVAFAATGLGPAPSTNIFSGLPGIDTALNQPWTIYTAAPDLAQPNAVVDEALIVRALRFSPDGSKLAFNATNYKGHEGVFVVELASGAVVQIWEKDVDFDWSPDGQRMLIMVDDPMLERSIFYRSVILDLSKLEEGTH